MVAPQMVRLDDHMFDDAAIHRNAIRRVLKAKVLAALNAAGLTPCEQKRGKLLKAGYRIYTSWVGSAVNTNVIVDVGIPPIHGRHWSEIRIGIETEKYVAALLKAGITFKVNESAWSIVVNGPATGLEIEEEERRIRVEHEVAAIKQARYNVALAMTLPALPDDFRERLDAIRHDMSARVGQEL